MPQEYRIVSIRETAIPDPKGEFIPYVICEFYYKEHGPFRVEMKKVDWTADAMIKAINAQVEQIKKVLGE